MNRLLVHARCLSLVICLAASAKPAVADVPAPLQQRQQQLTTALSKVRLAVVGVSDGMGVGSGIVVSRDGVVLTASHVVDSGRRSRRGTVTITYPDGREYRANVLGKNRDADAAVLKISDPAPGNEGFPFAEMGRLSESKVGDWCFALGHPGGYRPDREAPVRIGRVLSIGNRTVVSDCAILLGDSGGPLFNMRGEVIGIHSMITSLITENRHVSVDTFHDDWDRLLAGDRWGRLRSMDNDIASSGFFGVNLKWKDFTPEVTGVLKNSPAEKAGLKNGDVLLKIEGEPIADRLDLGTTLDLLEEEQPIELIVRRGNGTEETLKLVTGDDSDPDVDDERGEGPDRLPTLDDEEREREILEQLSDDRSIGRFEKRAADELKLYEGVAGVSQQSVVAVRDNGLLLCLGTVMSSDGYILTKASELDGAIDPEIILPDGRRFRGQEMAADYSYDLMLLKVDAKDLKPAGLRTETLPAGTMALVQDPRGKALIPTVVSVVAHTSESAKRAFLGITMPDPENHPNEPMGNGVRIVEVLAGGAAVRNGLKPNDRILSVDGNDVHDPNSLKHRIGGFKPGDKVAIRFMREDAIRTIEILLTSKFTNENALLPLYQNRDPELTGHFASMHAQGFPRALQIDADVYPTKVGGPLLDLNGNAIGIVIARADRFPTYAIPADAVKTVFEQLRAEAANKKPEEPAAE